MICFQEFRIPFEVLDARKFETHPVFVSLIANQVAARCGSRAAMLPRPGRSQPRGHPARAQLGENAGDERGRSFEQQKQRTLNNVGAKTCYPTVLPNRCRHALLPVPA